MFYQLNFLAHKNNVIHELKSEKNLKLYYILTLLIKYSFLLNVIHISYYITHHLRQFI